MAVKLFTESLDSHWVIFETEQVYPSSEWTVPQINDETFGDFIFKVKERIFFCLQYLFPVVFNKGHLLIVNYEV